jgi:hypothetical protein
MNTDNNDLINQGTILYGGRLKDFKNDQGVIRKNSI